jgi:alkaline phosphatase D
VTAHFTRRRLLAGSAGAVAVAALSTACATAPTPNPFTLGVASGDPTPDGFVIWTRLAQTPTSPDGLGGMGTTPVPVTWQVATDPNFATIVRSGSTTATPTYGYSVHILLTGLTSGSVYYYRFTASGYTSTVGRTRTAPATTTSAPLLLAALSCANWEEGYFTAYRRLSTDNPDLVVALGDYIYEGAARPVGPGVYRSHAGGECFTLANYRQRYAQYKTDADLQAAHAAAPWIVIPDDHEVQNDYAGTVPEYPDPNFAARRAAAYQAYWENMPLRPSSVPIGNSISIYRRLTWGSLVNLHLLDTRQYRDDQACGDGNVSNCDARLDPNRTMLGAAQEAWLANGLATSTATWDVIGNQVVMSQLDRDPGPGKTLQMDSWDGYAADRGRVLQMMAAGGAGGRALNPVVFTGDVHRNYASDLYVDFDATSTSSPIGVELIATSISSTGDGSDTAALTDSQLAINPNLQFANSQRGYILTRFSATTARTDYRVIPYVSRAGAPVSTRASFTIPAGDPGLQRIA